ncbi:hypothetical protein [Streptomyces thioluteus]|uniref:hypothetical protein n=1 Tax=Streptomyces thioluteus TaxID=66431 RepID=UPI0031E8FCDA
MGESPSPGTWPGGIPGFGAEDAAVLPRLRPPHTCCSSFFLITADEARLRRPGDGRR